MAINTSSLIYFLTDAVSAYTEDFTLIQRENPVLFEMNGVQYSVHISSVHDSGNSRANPDEQRIQIQRSVIDKQRSRHQNGIVTLFIGFFPDGTVFTAWEPEHVFSQNPTSGGSVYSRLSHQRIASDVGSAVFASRSTNLGRGVVTISLRSEALGFYCENWALLHTLNDEADAERLINSAAIVIEADSKPGKTEKDVTIAGQRKLITITRTAFARGAKFRDDIMRAYGGRCCVCGRQLGLVQAAHIIPHNHPESVDHISNGLALCVEHHKFYDDVLLLPAAGQRFHLNELRVEHLRNIGQDSGIDAVRALAQTNYRVPDHVPSRPNDDYLERGRLIRLG